MRNPGEVILCAAILLVACFTSAAVTFRHANPPSLNNTRDKDIPDHSAALLNQTNRRFEGNASAPYTLVEFMDYECPPCRASFKSVNSLLRGSQGKLRLSVHHFPLSYHPHAEYAAITAEAVAQQADFWWIHRSLMESVLMDKDSVAHILAKKEIDKKRFAHDYTTIAQSNVNADLRLAQKLNINATPTFFLCLPNGHAVKLASLQHVPDYIR